MVASNDFTGIFSFAGFFLIVFFFHFRLQLRVVQPFSEQDQQ